MATKRRRADLRARLRQLKDETPCVDCGVQYRYWIMQFDHLGDKERAIADLISAGWSWKRILAEIAKCDAVCANCHAGRTHARLVASDEAVSSVG